MACIVHCSTHTPVLRHKQAVQPSIVSGTRASSSRSACRVPVCCAAVNKSQSTAPQTESRSSHQEAPTALPDIDEDNDVDEEGNEFEEWEEYEYEVGEEFEEYEDEEDEAEDEEEQETAAGIASAAPQIPADQEYIQYNQVSSTQLICASP